MRKSKPERIVGLGIVVLLFAVLTIALDRNHEYKLRMAQTERRHPVFLKRIQEMGTNTEFTFDDGDHLGSFLYTLEVPTERAEAFQADVKEEDFVSIIPDPAKRYFFWNTTDPVYYLRLKKRTPVFVSPN